MENKTLKDLGKCMINASIIGANYFIVEVKIEDFEKPELILMINERENIYKKLKYYIESYNEDLTLKTNNNIKIVDFYFVENISFSKRIRRVE